jgi:hypothetical protein
MQAVLMVAVRTAVEFVDAVCEETAALNPALTSSQLKGLIQLSEACFGDDPDDAPSLEIKEVDFANLGIKALPEIFGHLKLSGNLDLRYNELTSLPESMRWMQVGGDLHLSNNKLSWLPGGVAAAIQVKGELHLYDNNFPDPKPTAADFPNVQSPITTY